MTQEYKNIKSHLQQHPNNFVDVIDYNTKLEIDKKLFLKEIEEKHTDLDGYLSHLVSEKERQVQFYLRRKHGTGVRLIGGVENMRIKPNKEPDVEVIPVNNDTVHKNPTPNYPQNNNNGLNGFNAMGSNIDYQNNFAGDIYLLRQQVLALKENNAELKQERNDFRNESITLRRERDDLKSEVNLAEREKAFALKEAAINNKSFLDSESGQLFLTGALDTVKGITSAKMQNGVQAEEYLGTPQQTTNLSEYKKALFGQIEPEGVTDVICSKLYLTLQGLKTEDFTKEHLELLNKFDLKAS